MTEKVDFSFDPKGRLGTGLYFSLALSLTDVRHHWQLENSHRPTMSNWFQSKFQSCFTFPCVTAEMRKNEDFMLSLHNRTNKNFL